MPGDFVRVVVTKSGASRARASVSSKTVRWSSSTAVTRSSAGPRCRCRSPRWSRPRWAASCSRASTTPLDRASDSLHDTLGPYWRRERLGRSSSRGAGQPLRRGQAVRPARRRNACSTASIATTRRVCDGVVVALPAGSRLAPAPPACASWPAARRARRRCAPGLPACPPTPRSSSCTTRRVRSRRVAALRAR